MSGNPKRSRQTDSELGSKRFVADDAGALHLAMARRIVHDRIVLGSPVIPYRHAVFLPAPADLILWNVSLADQVIQQQSSARIGILTKSDVFPCVEIGEV